MLPLCWSPTSHLPNAGWPQVARALPYCPPVQDCFSCQRLVERLNSQVHVGEDRFQNFLPPYICVPASMILPALTCASISRSRSGGDTLIGASDPAVSQYTPKS